jgi:hypothetical protein
MEAVDEDRPPHTPPTPEPNFTYKMKIILGFIQVITNIMCYYSDYWPYIIPTYL